MISLVFLSNPAFSSGVFYNFVGGYRWLGGQFWKLLTLTAARCATSQMVR
jgi:hypothetical protein